MPFSSSQSNSRQPSNIPLRALPASSGSRSHDTHDAEETTSFLRAGPAAGAASSSSSHHGYAVDKPGSDSDLDSQDTDSWVETGDIGDQIDAEDPLRARLNDTLDESVLAGLKPRHIQTHGPGTKKEKKHVRIHDDAVRHLEHRAHQHHHSHGHSGVVNKEAIEIPEVISSRPSRAQRLFAAIMPGASRGFTGKPLMWVSAIHIHVFVDCLPGC